MRGTDDTPAAPPWWRWPLRPSRRRATAAALSVVTLGLAGPAWVGADPAGAERVGLQARLYASGLTPAHAESFVGSRTDYGYDGSPWLHYAAYEARWTPVDGLAVRAFADGIAEQVGWRLLVATGETDVGRAERVLWARGEADRLPLWIAHALRQRDVFYHRESLLSRAFDPALHDGAQIHLDCDLLVHLFAHVAWRLDLDFREVGAPVHTYLAYQPPQGVDGPTLTVETTSFRHIDVDGARVDYLGKGLGDDFFVAADWHASGKSGTWASDDLVAAAGLYQPQDQRAVTDGVVANVLAGLEQHHIAAPLQDEARARLDGTRSYVLVSNLWEQLIEEGQAALDQADPATAIDRARESVALRDRFPHLVVRPQPVDRLLLAQAWIASAGPGQIADAGPVIDQALAAYRAPVRDPQGRPMAADVHHANLLVLDAETRGVADAARCDGTLGSVQRWLAADGRGARPPAIARVCAVAAAHAELCAGVVAGCAGP